MADRRSNQVSRVIAGIGRGIAALPRAIWRYRKALILRGYALIIMLVVVWTGYTALAYLVGSVFTPARVPRRLLEWQARLDVSALRAEAAAGVTRPAPRAPLGHYHGVDRWFQPDPRNNCTTSGCHAPLPHAGGKELRAMANLHVTFLDCMMCHDRSAEAAVPAVWVSTSTGQVQDPPSLLRLAQLLGKQENADMQSSALHKQTLDLLRESIDAAGGEPFLEDVRVRMDTAEPGSPVWRHAFDHLRDELPSRLRGEYGAKLMPTARTAVVEAEAERARRGARLTPDDPERLPVLNEIHAAVLERPAACVACHNFETPRLNFETLGYTPVRAAELRGSPVARMMRQIQEGRPFHLPRLLEPADDR